MPSFNYVNYFLRTNKNIERKLIFESLEYLGKVFDISGYRYLGLGSIWFVDFLIAHKLLGISDMISIEKDAIGFSRACFNKPFRCIEVEEGESSQIIPGLNVGDKSLIAWLDYDKDLDQSSALEDISSLCSKAKSRSIIIITINAHFGQLNRLIESDGEAFEKIRIVVESEHASESEKLRAIAQIVERTSASKMERRIQALSKLAGNLVPADLSKKDLQQAKFPKLLALILFNQFRHSVLASGRRERFYPLFNFSYQDNAPMVTVGGIIVNDDDAHKIEEVGLKKKKWYIGEEQVSIQVPPLTVKEKIMLDQLLPNENELTANAVEMEHSVLLDEDHLSAYQQFYKYYPIYGELEL